MKKSQRGLLFLCVWMLLCLCGGANAQSWLLGGYTYRTALTITNNATNALTGAQKQLKEGDLPPGIFTHALSTGADIRFTSSDGTTLLNYYRESYNPTLKTASLWLRLPTLAAGSSTSPSTATVYLYYGKAGATDASTFGTGAANGGTFDRDYVALTSYLGAYDFTSGAASDLSTNGHDGTLVNAPTFTASDLGVFNESNQGFSSGSYVSFNGTNQKITFTGLLSTFPSSSTGVTVSLVWRPDVAMYVGAAGNNTGTHANPRIFEKWTGGASANTFDWYIGTDGHMNVLVYIAGTPLTVTSQSAVWQAGKDYFLEASIGPAGTQLWVNGKLEGFNPNTTMPASDGSGAAPAQIGGYHGSSGSNDGFMQGSISRLRILNYQRTPDESNYAANGRKFVAGCEIPTKLTRAGITNPILAPEYGLNGTVLDTSHVLEPNVWKIGSTYHMLYTGLNIHSDYVGASLTLNPDGTPLGPFLFYANGTDGLNYTRQNSGVPVIGNGHGGEAGLANESCSCYDAANNRVLIYYGTGYGTPGQIRVESTTDFITYTYLGVAVDNGAQGWFTNPANMTVVKDPLDGKFKMIAEMEIPNAQAGHGNYLLAYAESDNGVTGWKFWSGNPIASLQRGIGTQGGPTLMLIGNTYHLVTHDTVNWSNTVADHYHTYLWHATIPQASLSLKGNPGAWTKDDYPFLFKWDYQFTLGKTGSQDQVGDAQFTEVSGTSYLHVDVDFNSGYSGQNANISALKYSGTLAQLFTPFPLVSTGFETSQASVTLTPGSATPYTFSVALTGTNTLWAGTPFSIPLTAATISQTITDFTHATITITPNGVASPFTVTDNSTGQTFSVSAPATSSASRRFIH